MNIYRYLAKKIENDLGKGKIIILCGARQVGKTTLVRGFLRPNIDVYYNCDQEDVRESFEKANLEHLSSLVKKYDRVIVDEAQRVKNIGLTLKILIDNFPEKNFIVTGSSSLELANTISEPLTGRYFSHLLFPISFLELSSQLNPLRLMETLEERMIFGSYPEVVTTQDRRDKQRIVEGVAADYLFKDILNFGIVRNPDMLKKLLRAIALQLGNEVSVSELSRTLEVDNETVKRYLDLCEKLFILVSLAPYHSNKRKSIAKMKKYYFFDLGIRNALIQNFNPLSVRNDVGALWENLMVLERTKRNSAQDIFPQYFFWRSYQGQEIDLIEDTSGTMRAFEFKYKKDAVPKKVREIFLQELGGKEFSIVRKENFMEFVL